MTTPRKTALERLEELADAVYGRGSAVSVDREDGAVVVRVWNAIGAPVAQSTGATRTACCSDLLSRLGPPRRVVRIS